jgi:hypothetical protein
MIWQRTFRIMVLAWSSLLLLFCRGLFPFDFAKIPLYHGGWALLLLCDHVLQRSRFGFRRNIASYSSLLNC